MLISWMLLWAIWALAADMISNHRVWRTGDEELLGENTAGGCVYICVHTWGGWVNGAAVTAIYPYDPAPTWLRAPPRFSNRNYTSRFWYWILTLPDLWCTAFNTHPQPRRSNTGGYTHWRLHTLESIYTEHTQETSYVWGDMARLW